jgi:hypothetical protein
VFVLLSQKNRKSPYVCGVCVGGGGGLFLLLTVKQISAIKKIKTIRCLKEKVELKHLIGIKPRNTF